MILDYLIEQAKRMKLHDASESDKAYMGVNVDVDDEMMPSAYKIVMGRDLYERLHKIQGDMRRSMRGGK